MNDTSLILYTTYLAWYNLRHPLPNFNKKDYVTPGKLLLSALEVMEKDPKKVSKVFYIILKKYEEFSEEHPMHHWLVNVELTPSQFDELEENHWYIRPCMWWNPRRRHLKHFHKWLNKKMSVK